MRQRSFFLTNPDKQPINVPTIGIVGVMLPGTITCMIKINERAQSHFERHHHPNIIVEQQNFGPTREAQRKGRWDIVENRLVESIEKLAQNGADFVIIPANTGQKLIENIKKRVTVPIISMLEVVAAECQRLNWKKVGVLGAEHLYQKQLAMHNIEEVILSQADQDLVQKAIVEILIPAGIIRPQLLDALLDVVHRLKERGCEGIILACTKLPLVLNKESCRILPMLDSIAILAEEAVQQVVTLMSLGEDQSWIEARL